MFTQRFPACIPLSIICNYLVQSSNNLDVDGIVLQVYNSGYNKIKIQISFRNQTEHTLIFTCLYMDQNFSRIRKDNIAKGLVGYTPNHMQFCQIVFYFSFHLQPGHYQR